MILSNRNRFTIALSLSRTLDPMKILLLVQLRTLSNIESVAPFERTSFRLVLATNGDEFRRSFTERFPCVAIDGITL